MAASRFTDEQQTLVAEIVERRLARERRAHARALAEQRARHQRDMQTLQTEIERLHSERSILQRLANRWFLGREHGHGLRT